MCKAREHTHVHYTCTCTNHVAQTHAMHECVYTCTATNLAGHAHTHAYTQSHARGHTRAHAYSHAHEHTHERTHDCTRAHTITRCALPMHQVHPMTQASNQIVLVLQCVDQPDCSLMPDTMLVAFSKTQKGVCSLCWKTIEDSGTPVSARQLACVLCCCGSNAFSSCPLPFAALAMLSTPDNKCTLYVCTRYSYVVRLQYR